MVIQCRDTDVLVIAVGLRQHLPSEIWISCGTSKNAKYIPVNAINYPPLVMDSVIAYHSATGCDTTSQFSGEAKRSTWIVYVKDPALLAHLGESPGLSEVRASEEQFVCGIYRYGSTSSINDVRLKMFSKGNSSVESLPPSQDALHLHLDRANYQAFIWKKAVEEKTDCPLPADHGWVMESGKVKPKLMRLDPIPKKCAELVTCSCKVECSPTRCGCHKTIGSCTSAFLCGGVCQN